MSSYGYFGFGVAPSTFRGVYVNLPKGKCPAGPKNSQKSWDVGTAGPVIDGGEEQLSSESGEFIGENNTCAIVEHLFIALPWVIKCPH